MDAVVDVVKKHGLDGDDSLHLRHLRLSRNSHNVNSVLCFSPGYSKSRNYPD